jgi:hypothetical protein
MALNMGESGWWKNKPRDRENTWGKKNQAATNQSTVEYLTPGVPKETATQNILHVNIIRAQRNDQHNTNDKNVGTFKKKDD